MSRFDSNHDDHFDAQMRAVPLPEGFVERLRLAVVSDEELDSLVSDVPVPAGLLDRIREAVLVEQQVEELVASPRPRSLRLAESLRRRKAKRRLQARRSRQWAAALAVVAVLGLGYVAIMTGLVFPTQSSDRRLAAKSSEDDMVDEVPKALVFSETTMPAEESVEAVDIANVAPPMPLVRFASSDARRSWLAEKDERFGPGSPNPFADALSRRWGGVFTSHRPFDDLPELKKAAGLSPRGIAWPVVAGANSAFLIRYGVHPFVSPASDPQLSTLTVPLCIDAASYELAKRWLEDRELPPPDQVRTEEFLAAVDYEFTRPTGQPLALSVAGGPSPLGAPNMQLLQIGVQASPFVDVDRPGTHLVLAVDVSASMRWGGRFDMVRQSLRKLIRQFGPHDRVSLVAFSEGSETIIEDVGAADASQFVAALRSLRIRSSTNVGAGLCHAYAVAQELAVEYRSPVRVVLLTDGLAELDRPTAERIEKQLAEAAQQSIALDVVDLGQEKAVDLQLASFAKSGNGALRSAASADQIRWALLESLTGRSQLVARNAVMKVSFNPNAVAGYRLFGHEAKTIAGVLPDRSETDFYVDQSANVLCEVLFKPGNMNEVATVELSWEPTEGGQRQSVVRQVSRSEFAGSFVSAPLSLQEAAVVAGTAEVLRESPFARVQPYSVTLGRIRELIGQVDSRLQQRAAFSEFVATLDQAIRAKPYRGGGRRW